MRNLFDIDDEDSRARYGQFIDVRNDTLEVVQVCILGDKRDAD